MIKRKICLYDGFSLLIHDPSSIEYIRNNPKKFKLLGEYNMKDGQALGTFRGTFKKLKIRTGGTKRGVGIIIRGSFHVWKNGDHNYDVFYWSDLRQVLKEIAQEFQFNIEQVDVLSIEVGINLRFKAAWKYQSQQLVRNAVLFGGEPMLSTRKKMPNGGYFLEMVKSEISNKLYDKGRQHKLGNEVLRSEMRFLKNRTSNIRLFSELLDDGKHDALVSVLIKNFETLILIQPEILDKQLTIEERQFIIEHRHPDSWLNLRKSRAYREVKKRREKLDFLTDKHCEVNYHKELLNMMKELVG
jgi:hypothetical protein